MSWLEEKHSSELMWKRSGSLERVSVRLQVCWVILNGASSSRQGETSVQTRTAMLVEEGGMEMGVAQGGVGNIIYTTKMTGSC